MKGYCNSDKLYFAHCDCAAAIQNMLLTMRYYELGGCWVNTSHGETKIEEMKQFFNIPTNFIIGGLIPFGVPAHSPKTPGRKTLKLRINMYD